MKLNLIFIWMLQFIAVTIFAQQQSVDSLKKEEYIKTMLDTLPEVTVKSYRPIYKMKDGDLVVRIQGTPFSKEETLNDVLEHIPGMIKQADGSLVVFGLGSPEIYINGRKATSHEWQSIDIKQIDNIRLITNPGAKYGATVGAVLKINLKRKDEGCFSILRLKEEQSETNTNSEEVTFGWTSKKLNVSTYYSYEDNRYNVRQPQAQKLTMKDGTYNFWADRNGKNKGYLNNSEMKLDYQFSDKQIVGILWESNWVKGGRNESSTQHYQQPEGLPYSFFSEGREQTKDNSWHINLFHKGQWNAQFGSEIYLDFARNHDRVNQPVSETDNTETTLIQTRSITNYHVYSGRLGIEWAFNKNHTLFCGTEYSLVDGGGNLQSDASSVTEADYGNREEKKCSYIEYKGEAGSWNWQAGLRYEHLNSHYTNYLTAAESMNHKYDQWFPSFSIGLQQGSWNHSLRFTTQTDRPSFRQLSSATYYVNRFFYQEGNPKLQPQTSYSLTWMTAWKDFSGNLTYKYTKDFLSNSFKTPDEKPVRLISTFSNFDHIQHLRAALDWQHAFGCWKPNISVNLDQQFFKVKYLDTALSCNGNSWNISINNYFVLSNNCQLSLSYFFSNGGIVNDCHFKPYQNWTLGITKTFFTNKLSISAKANDLFHQYYFREKLKLGNVNFAQTEDYKLWYYRLTISFRFNQLKSKYRGINAAQQEMNRL